MESFLIFFKTGVPSKILYTSLLIAGVLILLGQFGNFVKEKRSFTLWILFVEYLFVVVCSTIIFRPSIICGFDRLELIPFWTYWAVVVHTPGVSVWDIVLNVVLFMPHGFLIKLLYPKLELWKMILIAVGCSMIIETNQYFFEKGIAQTDDIMHNVLGGVIGWGLAWLCVHGFKRFKNSSIRYK